VPQKDLVDRLIDLRHQAGLSQAALAAKLNITGASVAFYETRRRRVPVAMVRRWVEACGLELHEVFLAPGTVLEATLEGNERRLLADFRDLHEDDRRLVLDFARGLRGGSPILREAIALQVPLLLRSATSDVEGDVNAPQESNGDYKMRR
jgi:transcriptional regulator with XRE-family HTH domain